MSMGLSGSELKRNVSVVDRVVSPLSSAAATRESSFCLFGFPSMAAFGTGDASDARLDDPATMSSKRWQRFRVRGRGAEVSRWRL